MIINVQTMTDPELQEKSVELNKKLAEIDKEAWGVRAQLDRVGAEQYRRYRKICDKFKELS